MLQLQGSWHVVLSAERNMGTHYYRLFRVLIAFIVFLAVVAVYSEVRRVQANEEGFKTLKLIHSKREIAEEYETTSEASSRVTPVPEVKSKNVFGKPIVGADQIFLVEISCTSNVSNVLPSESVVRLDATQACAVESAAKNNPNTSVFLYHSCFLDDKSLARSSKMVQNIFKKYDNLFLFHESLEGLLKDTDMEKFYQSGRLFKSKYLVVHASDIARLVLLWKYGGRYFDLDFIIFKEVAPLGSDYVVIGNGNDANNAAVAFKHEGVGHKFVSRWLQEIRDVFKGEEWAEIGPDLLTPLLSEFCNLHPLRPTATSAECGGLVIYPPRVFHPIVHYHWKKFFATEPLLRDEAMALTKDAYGVHLWASMMKFDGVEKEYRAFDRNSVNHPKAIYQQRHCPLAYAGKRL